MGKGKAGDLYLEVEFLPHPFYHVEGLDGAFGLDLIVRRDPRSNVTLIDACIDRRRTMITHRCGLQGSRLSLFCWLGCF